MVSHVHWSHTAMTHSCGGGEIYRSTAAGGQTNAPERKEGRGGRMTTVIINGLRGRVGDDLGCTDGAVILSRLPKLTLLRARGLLGTCTN